MMCRWPRCVIGIAAYLLLGGFVAPVAAGEAAGAYECTLSIRASIDADEARCIAEAGGRVVRDGPFVKVRLDTGHEKVLQNGDYRFRRFDRTRGLLMFQAWASDCVDSAVVNLRTGDVLSMWHLPVFSPGGNFAVSMGYRGVCDSTGNLMIFDLGPSGPGNGQNVYVYPPVASAESSSEGRAGLGRWLENPRWIDDDTVVLDVVSDGKQGAGRATLHRAGGKWQASLEPAP